MEYHSVNLPDGCEKFGVGIYSDDDKMLLSEDMLDVKLPNGLYVHCGWYERGEPGRYLIQVADGLNIIHQESVSQATDACRLVETLSVRFSQGKVSEERQTD